MNRPTKNACHQRFWIMLGLLFVLPKQKYLQNQGWQCCLQYSFVDFFSRRSFLISPFIVLRVATLLLCLWGLFDSVICWFWKCFFFSEQCIATVLPSMPWGSVPALWNRHRNTLPQCSESWDSHPAGVEVLPEDPVCAWLVDRYPCSLIS